MDSDAGTDGFAMASLLCGLAGLVPLAAVFGMWALVRIGRNNRSGRGPAVAGLALSVLWLGVGVIRIPCEQPHDEQIFASRPG